MIKFIAHRGLTEGPDNNLENHPNQIINSWSKGFECEIDLWMTDGKLYLGHDDPQYQIDEEFLIKGPLWIHAKNLQVLEYLYTTRDLIYFWHQEDDFTLTSHRYIWTYPGKPLSNRSIQVMPEWEDKEFNNINFSCYGICSDYVDQIKKIYIEKQK